MGSNNKSVDLNEVIRNIENAWYAQFEPTKRNSYVTRVFSDFVIVDTDGGLFRYGYEITADGPYVWGEPQKVERREIYLPTVKAINEDDAGCVVGGYLLLWGDEQHRDLQGDYFTRETDLMLDHYKAAPALFHHSLDSNADLAVIGKRISAEVDDIGVKVQDWIDKSNQYWRIVEPLLAAERLYYSPGSAPHMVKRAGKGPGRLLSFPVVEDTLTPIPAQYRLRPVEQIKAAYKAAAIDMPEIAAETAGAGASDVEVLKAAIELETLLIQLEESA